MAALEEPTNPSGVLGQGKPVEKPVEKRQAEVPEKAGAQTSTTNPPTTADKGDLGKIDAGLVAILAERAEKLPRDSGGGGTGKGEAATTLIDSLVEELDKAIRVKEQAVAKLEQQRADAAKRIKSVRAERSQAHKARAASEQTAAQLEQQRADYQKQIETLTKERDNIVKQRDELSAQMAHGNGAPMAEVDALAKEREALVAERDRLAQELEQARAKLSDTGKAPNEKSGAVSPDASDLTRQRDELAAKAESFSSMIMEKDGKIGTLRPQVW